MKKMFKLDALFCNEMKYNQCNNKKQKTKKKAEVSSQGKVSKMNERKNNT